MPQPKKSRLVPPHICTVRLRKLSPLLTGRMLYAVVDECDTIPQLVAARSPAEARAAVLDTTSDADEREMVEGLLDAGEIRIVKLPRYLTLTLTKE